MGINLAGPADWNTELPFVDVFHFSRAWISQRRGGAWGKGPALDCDVHGWVKRLEPGSYAETLLCTIEGGHYPSGVYTVLYDGNGDITVSGAASITEGTQPGHMTIKVDAARGGFFLQIRRTDPTNYIRNIRVLMPGSEKTYQTQPFEAGFLSRWKGVACYRFMDWMMTNDAKAVRWEQRPTLEDATWTQAGVPLEMMIDLCNRQKADGWFCIPHTADDDYVRHFAELLKARLDPSLHAYIEYSNEVWNPGFISHRYAVEQAAKQQLGDASKPWETACQFYVKRSQEVFRITRDVFEAGDKAGGGRIVRVLAWQAAGGQFWLDGELLGRADPSMVDALAIAPYVALMPAMNGDGPSAAEVAGWSSDQLFAYLNDRSLPQSIRWMKEAATAAEKHHVRLLAYESGQHLVGVAGGESNETMNKLFYAANADPRMGMIYDAFLKAWQDNGGDLLCAFSSVGRWSKWGSWGLLQYVDEDPARSPKYAATMRWGTRWGAGPVGVGSGK